ncbi:hypothetical protein AXG93_3109s1020 [Marchantia polymorpha subsp. ruderalis]|uniref:Uncharacterized protein n=1 Tax=Marchantia polymorpha subsp. ruderalis TaxID=1480154 RepID=A0A176VS93_MARPO|nr:hypothetical protein AXG93_3109s1020 [Marchantia polymorpha subsp. ruderalis]
MAEKGTGKDAEQFVHKDYHDPPPSPLIDASEFGRWSFYRAIIAEFVATLLFLYITVATVIGTSRSTSAEAPCGGVGILGIAWAFGGMIFVLVYCTAGISAAVLSSSTAQAPDRQMLLPFIFREYGFLLVWVGVVKEKQAVCRLGCEPNLDGVGYMPGCLTDVITALTLAESSGGHINPAVTFGLFLARKVTLPRAVLYMIAQCLGAICGCGLVKAWQSSLYNRYGGGANSVASGYSKGTGLGAEIIGTFVLVYTVFSATDPKRNARDSHVPVLAPLPIGFAVFMVHLATIPITGTGINPARSFGAAVIFNAEKSWDDHWIFWVGPFIGAALAAAYHQYVLRAGPFKALGSFRSQAHSCGQFMHYGLGLLITHRRTSTGALSGSGSSCNGKREAPFLACNLPLLCAFRSRSRMPTHSPAAAAAGGGGGGVVQPRSSEPQELVMAGDDGGVGLSGLAGWLLGILSSPPGCGSACLP